MSHRYALIPASYVYLRRSDEVLLQQRRNTGYMDGHWVAGAAGHLEPGETAVVAAVREVSEELGVDIRSDDLSLVTVMQRTDGTGDPIEQRVDWFWTVDRWQGEPGIQEPDKCAGLAWFSLDALPGPMPRYEQMVLGSLRGAHLPGASSYGFGT